MTPEFSRVVAADRIGREGFEQTVAASEAECRAVAARLGVPAVHALSATFRLRRALGEAVRIEATCRLAARLSLVCVLTSNEFETDVTVEAHLRFVPAGSESDDDDPEAEDEVAFAGGGIDLGEAAVEELALSLDPYPRKPGAELPAVAREDTPHPFSVLGKRRD